MAYFGEIEDAALEAYWNHLDFTMETKTLQVEPEKEKNPHVVVLPLLRQDPAYQKEQLLRADAVASLGKVAGIAKMMKDNLEQMKARESMSYSPVNEPGQEPSLPVLEARTHNSRALTKALQQIDDLQQHLQETEADVKNQFF